MIKTLVLLAILITAALVVGVRQHRQLAARQKAMDACVKWATVNVPNVDARAWCEP